MRMRKKKHLDERMLECSDYLIKTEVGERDSRVAEADLKAIDFKALFGNANPVELEIGCGKGGFVCAKAEQNPNINYIAVEKVSNVIVSACEMAKNKNLKNVRFLNLPAEYLLRYIPKKSIDRIYLNFSCPYPKTTYANRRLTNPKFLKVYEQLLTQKGEIHQKTDNMAFFEYSLEQLSDCGYTLKNISLDLHNSSFEGNIMTEYEERFCKLKMPIYRAEAYKKCAE